MTTQADGTEQTTQTSTIDLAEEFASFTGVSTPQEETETQTQTQTETETQTETQQQTQTQTQQTETQTQQTETQQTETQQTETQTAKTPEQLEIERLQADLNEMRNLLAQSVRGGQTQVFPQTQQTETQQTQQTEQTATQTAKTLQALFNKSDLPVLTADEIDEIVDKPELVVKAINKARTDVLDQVETILPNLIAQQVNSQILINKAVTEFYDTNRDLIPFADFFQAELAKAEVANRTTKTYREIFDLAANETRTKLRLNKPSTAQTDQTSAQTQQSGPAFASTKQSSTGRVETGTRKGLAGEWDSLTK